MSVRIKVNDEVVVIAGKDKGKRGRVRKILHDENRVVVEGVNKMVKHYRRNPQNPAQNGRSEVDAPLHISNVMPWSDADSKGVRVRMGTEKDGAKFRMSAASNERLRASATPVEEEPKKKKAAKKKKAEVKEDDE